MAVQNNANIGFEKQIWDAACVLWGHIPAAEYRKVIVGLIFLRYISSAFEKRYQQLVEEGDGFEDDKDAYAEDNIFFVPEDARWSKIASAAHTPEIGTVIDEAMRAIEKENTTLKNVLPKNYASPDLDKRVLGEVVDLFTNMDMGDTEESKDLLGRTYEYCIQQFAAYEGVKGGEFYTPASIVKTIVAILKPFKNCRVYDPCCGSGGMFVQSAKFIQAHSGKRGEIAVYGQESNADTWKMAKMNMAIRGIDADFGPYQADTFFNDLHKTLKADFIMANPPFNLSNWGQDKLKDDVRWKYGTPPAGNATLDDKERVLLVTFNTTLVKYLEAIVGSEIPRNIDVRNYHKFARGYLAHRNKMPRWNGIVSGMEDGDNKKQLFVRRALEKVKAENGTNSTLKRSEEVFLEEINWIEKWE